MPIDGKFGQITLGKQPGTPVPDDMPCFVLLARDVSALGALRDYRNRAWKAGIPPEGMALLDEAIARFSQFRDEHPEQMKVGSITMKARS